MTASTLLLKMIKIECIESVKYTINFNVETVKKKRKKDISIKYRVFFHLTWQSGKVNISIENKETSH